MASRSGTRTLTEKGRGYFQERVDYFVKKLSDCEIRIDKVLTTGEHTEQWENDIKKEYSCYNESSLDFLDFLAKTGTKESDDLKVIYQNARDEILNRVQSAGRASPNLKKSPSQCGSAQSRVSSLIMRTKAKAEAAKIRLQFAQREIELEKQKAELENSMKLLNSERDVVEAEAELRVMQEEIEQDICTSVHDVQVTAPHQSVHVTPTTVSQPSLPKQAVFNSTLNPTAKSYVPNETPSALTELSKFLMKKDLLLSRLSKFNDRPEYFGIWKNSFKNIIQELDLSALEEIDLLIRWLGPDSSKQASSIRAANSHNPHLGLLKVWERLEDMYASPELVESALRNKLSSFPKITPRDNSKLYELSDIIAEIESVKDNIKYSSLLSYFDSSSGVTPIVNKLPYHLQDKWTNEAVRYKERHHVTYPPFSFFASFVNKQAKIRNDPSFIYDAHTPPRDHTKPYRLSTKKTDVESMSPKDITRRCPFHESAIGHTLNYCKGFRRLALAERRNFLMKKRVCLKCGESTEHTARDCQNRSPCFFCGSEDHPTALHQFEERSSNKETLKVHEGESQNKHKSVTSACTKVCEGAVGGKSCAKTILVRVFPQGFPEQSLLTYAVVDDQSNRSLARSSFFDYFKENGQETEYTLSSCAGSITTYGRQVSGYVVQALDGSSTLDLPTLIECNQIPDVREEIPTPQAAQHHPHLQDIAEFIPPIDPGAEILLLIGRDLLTAHYVLDQRTGPPDAPFAQKLHLGWAIIGNVCLGNVHRPDVVYVNKTHVLRNGRPTIMEPCPYNFEVKDNADHDDVFKKTQFDESLAPSIEDKEFLNLMDTEFTKDNDGYWTAPLPFRKGRPNLPSNRAQATHRAKLLHNSLLKDSTKRDLMVEFMAKIIDRGHAEVAPPLKKNQESWFLPLFGVYSSKKPGQIRGVFDSSSKCEGISLNSVLMTGPDLTNNLLGILLRFRTESIAITADVEQMFYCFKVKESHRDYLRFLWYRDNDPSKDLIEYRMTVHVFGNSPSPAVATYGLRKSVEEAPPDIRQFVEDNFYVDDALLSESTEDKAVSLIQRTQSELKTGGNIRLHKIVSNSRTVLSSFDTNDLAKDIKDLDLHVDNPPPQKSLGLIWNIAQDTFAFQVSAERKPFTRRGVLSTINSLYDPMGFVAPVVIKGKLLLRQLMSTPTGWDDQINDSYLPQWEKWCNSLREVEKIGIPRQYCKLSFSESSQKEVHIFSDASKEAISAVAYLKIYDVNSMGATSFLLGKAKVAPRHGHTIPRLELCAAVLSTQLADIVSQQLHITSEHMFFYTDSKVVLGYINNDKRRFHVYVANRIDRIRRSSQPAQWHHVPTQKNPADEATRLVSSWSPVDSLWLQGPDFPSENNTSFASDKGPFSLVDPENDKEVKPDIKSAKTSFASCQTRPQLDSSRFSRFSCWKRLTRTISHLKHIAKSFAVKSNQCTGWHQCKVYKNVEDYNEAEVFIIKTAQQEVYSEEIMCLQLNKLLPRKSSILALSPTLDMQGLLRIGGRLKYSGLSAVERNPLIIPKNHHVATLLVRYYHQKVRHQGRHLTEGALRSAGYWIIGAKRLVSSHIAKCVTCNRLRRKPETQQMADLPLDRLAPCPPFTYIGVDTFGPWEIITRRTRGGSANSKRWGILFTCLVVRAVHIEVVEEMSSSSFINCLRRFIGVRGEVKQIRSDRGTNFVGAIDSLNIHSVNVEQGPVQEFLYDTGVTWLFNTPHSSHMGGVWERMIGTTRRILDAMLLNKKHLTHEVLTTLMAEVAAIINARPLTSISTDPSEPTILSPAMLLTQKRNHTPSFDASFDIKVMCKSQWKSVQIMAEEFWRRWRSEYLHCMQVRPKWKVQQPNIKAGDIVLLKDDSSARNEWPIGLVESVFPGKDGLVRKAAVRVNRDSKPITYTRPVVGLVRLL